jgi:hypothetical protein
VLDVRDLAWNIFIPLLGLIILAVSLTVATNLFTSAKLRETEFALWRILGMRRGDLVITQIAPSDCFRKSKHRDGRLPTSPDRATAKSFKPKPSLSVTASLAHKKTLHQLRTEEGMTLCGSRSVCREGHIPLARQPPCPGGIGWQGRQPALLMYPREEHTHLTLKSTAPLIANEADRPHAIFSPHGRDRDRRISRQTPR